MQLTTLLLAILPALALAAPEKRCTKYWPANVTTVSVYKASGQASTSQIIAWNLPADATGPCALRAYFPAGYKVNSYGNSQVNVYDVNGNSPGSMVGTVTFKSDPNQPTDLYINSFQCRSNFQYKFAIATTDGSGSVEFTQGSAAGIYASQGC